MKKEFKKPSLEVIEISLNDVILTSGEEKDIVTNDVKSLTGVHWSDDF